MARYFVDGMTATRSPETVTVEADNESEASKAVIRAGWLSKVSTVRRAPNGRAKYVVKISDGSGANRLTEIEADSLVSAVERLKGQGFRPLSLHKIVVLAAEAEARSGLPFDADTEVSTWIDQPQSHQSISRSRQALLRTISPPDNGPKSISKSSLESRAVACMGRAASAARKAGDRLLIVEELAPGIFRSNAYDQTGKMLVAAGLMHGVWVSVAATKQEVSTSFRPIAALMNILSVAYRSYLPHYSHNEEGDPPSDTDVLLIWMNDDDYFGGHAERLDTTVKLAIAFLCAASAFGAGTFDLVEEFLSLHEQIIRQIVSVDGYVSASEYKAIEINAAMRAYAAEQWKILSKPPDGDITDDLEGALGELDALVGLSEVKLEVRKFAALLQVARQRQEAGLPAAKQSLHFVFYGNPGTGKTTVARILGRIMSGYGLLKKGHVVETDRSGLVAEYLGQTATKTDAKVEEATDGILFVDEAYSLSRKMAGQGDSFGQEAIDTLLKRMEDRRDRLVVIAAGYPDEMAEFIGSNPGLKSRFTRYLRFGDYSVDELVEIFERMVNKGHYRLSGPAKQNVRQVVERVWAARDRSFGNAREMRNLFESVLATHALRLQALGRPATREELHIIEAADVLSC